MYCLTSDDISHRSHSNLIAGQREQQHPPIAWTASTANSRRDSMVFQDGFKVQVNFFRHSAAEEKTQTYEEPRDFYNKDTIV